MYTKGDVKWVAPDSQDGQKTLRQHAFVPVKLKRWVTREEYNGNRALCSKAIRVTSPQSDPDSENWILLHREGMLTGNQICQSCLKYYNRLPDDEVASDDPPLDGKTRKFEFDEQQEIHTEEQTTQQSGTEDSAGGESLS